MGVDVAYGAQKYWSFGGAYDGLYKVAAGTPDFKFGFLNDFIFPDDKQVAGIAISKATPTATVSLTMRPPALAVGKSTPTIIRKLGGVPAIYGQNKFFTNGLSSYGLNKKDAGQQTYWLFGNVDSDLFPSTQGAIAMGKASPVAIVSLKFSDVALAIGQATPIVIRKLGGAIDTLGGQKYWSVGEAMGLTFFALGNTVNTANKSKFADQSLWYYGIATPDLVGTSTNIAIISSPAKIISAQFETKRQVTGWLASVKIISAAIPTKKTSTL